MDTAGRCLFRFGDIEVDRASGYFRRRGTDKYLRQQTFQVLLYLLEHRHRVIPKEELRQAIWKEVAVGDDALVQCVAELRRVLGDNPRAPRYIKTVPKMGYRFIGPVEDIDACTPEPPPPAVDSPRASSLRLVAAACIVTTLLAGLLVYARRGWRASPGRWLSDQVALQPVPTPHVIVGSRWRPR